MLQFAVPLLVSRTSLDLRNFSSQQHEKSCNSKGCDGDNDGCDLEFVDIACDVFVVEELRSEYSLYR
jgi:hypothetical protein